MLNRLSDGRRPLFSRWARVGTCCSVPGSAFGLWPKPSEPASDLHSSSFHTPLDLRLMAVAPNAWLQYYLSSACLQYLSVIQERCCAILAEILPLIWKHLTLYISRCLGKTAGRSTASLPLTQKFTGCLSFPKPIIFRHRQTEIRPMLKSMQPIKAPEISFMMSLQDEYGCEYVGWQMSRW